MLLFPNKIPVKDEDPVVAKRRQMEEGQSVLEKAKGKGRRKDSYNKKAFQEDSNRSRCNKGDN